MPPGGIRTHNPNMRAAANPRLRPRGHCDRLFNSYIRKLQNVKPLEFNALTNITVVVKSGMRWADHVAHVTGRIIQSFGCRTLKAEHSF
jgi:hypothetical protein